MSAFAPNQHQQPHHQQPQHHQQQQPLPQQQQQKEYFLVQKCWFDGPNVQPPMDYTGIFTERFRAEELASQSAHLHAEHHHQAVVRTILLPSAGYAFSAAGDLFWVRSVWVDHVSASSSIDAQGAHAIFTANVVGGTGNVNSRRGSEAQTGVVFVGSDSHQRALQALVASSLSTTSSRNNSGNNNRRVGYLPFAPRTNPWDGWMGSNFMSEVAAAAQQEQQQQHKRSAMESANVVLNKEAYSESMDYRPVKRRCGPSVSHHPPVPSNMTADAVMQHSSS